MRKILTALTIVTAALLWFMSPLPPDWPVTIHAQGSASNYPIGYEVLCATGSQPIAQYTTYNPSTQRWRANFCVDGNGNMTLPVITGLTSNGNATNPTITITGTSNTGPQLILGFGNAGGASLGFGTSGPTITDTDGATLAVSGPFKFQTVLFASLGAVPGAGISKFCTDCTTAATCAGSGTGHLAVSNGTNWTCQ